MGSYCLDGAVHPGLVSAGCHRILIGGMATAGTALVCDWDHRHSTVANSLPPLSNVIAVGH